MTSHNLFTSRRLRLTPLVVVAAAAVALSGCNSGSGPNSTGTSPSVSATESVTPSATPTPTAAYKPADATGPAQNVPVPVLPEVAKTETKEGLEAFVGYWYSTLSYAYETGSVEALEKISGPDCANCQAAEKVIRNWYTEGRWLAGGKIVTPTIETRFVKTGDGLYQAIVQVQQSELRAYKADGTMSDTVVAPTDVGQIFLAAYSASGWHLVDAQRLNG
ncbi:DUF6318 family protein [Pseudarthrobacter sp. NPDC055928]|uniref:DUF6318 family protein n=1 Tax=Pseudarthrobacter sp. NPDC055928 TaxID=3345661 RepID=UPI0035E2A7FB